MNFDISAIWEKYRARPKWVQILLFVFVALAIIGLAIWGVVRGMAQRKNPVNAPLDVVEEHFEEVMADAQAKSDELDVAIEYEQDWRETLEEKQKRDHETAERTRDEIRDADSISDVTNALRNGRS